MPVVACSCGKKYRVGDDAVGKSIQCKGCGEKIPVRGGANTSSGSKGAAGTAAKSAINAKSAVKKKPAKKPAAPKTNRGDKGGKPKRGKAERASSGGVNPLKLIGGVLAIVIGLAALGGTLYSIFQPDGKRRAGGGAATAGVLLSVGWRWLRNEPVE